MNRLSKSKYESALKLAQEHRYQDAVRLCRLILLGDPKFVECRLLLARSLLTLARYDEVLVETQVLEEQAPDNPEVYALKGEAYFFRGEYMAAQRALQRALELDPQNTKVRRLLADIQPAVDAGEGLGEEAITDLSTRSYPVAEESDADPTELMESPPDEEAFERTLQALRERAEAAGQDSTEQPAQTAAAPSPSSTEPTPHDIEADSQPGEDAELLDTEDVETLVRVESGSRPREAQRPDRDEQPEPTGQEAATVSLKPGPRSRVRQAVIKGKPEEEEPVDEGPRGSVFKFVPSDQVVTVEQVAVTTGEIKSDGDGTEAVTKAEPLSRHRKDAREKRLGRPPVAADDWGDEPSVEVSGLEAEVVEVFEERESPPRLKKLSRHLPPPIRPPAARAVGELDDAPTTPHLDLKKVPPELPKVSATPERPARQERPTADELPRFAAPSSEAPASAFPDFVPAGIARRVGMGTPGGARPRGAEPPGPGIGPKAGGRPQPAIPVGPAGPAGGQPPSPPGMPGLPGGRRLPHHPPMPPAVGPQPPRPGPGPAVTGRPHPGRVEAPPRKEGPPHWAGAQPSHVARQAISRVTAAPPVRDSGRSRVTPMIGPSGLRRLLTRRWILVGVAAVLVLTAGTVAGFIVVAHRQRARLHRLRVRALTALAKGSPHALRAAEFSFARMKSLAHGRREARWGRALVRFVSTLEYGADPKLGLQLTEGQKPRTWLEAAAAILADVVAGRGPRALRESKRALLRHPKSSWVFYARAWALSASGDVEAARSALKRGLELKPSLGLLGRLLRMRLTAWAGQMDEARALADELTKSYPDHPAVQLAAARLVLDRCRQRGCPCPGMEKWLATLNRTVQTLQRQGPSTSVARLLLEAWGNCSGGSLRTGADAAQLHFPGRPDLEELVAWLLLQQRRFEGARRRLEQVTKAYPGRVPARLLLAQALVLSGLVDQAEVTLEKVPPRDRSAQWYAAAARVALAKGRHDQALRHLANGLKRFPGDLQLQLTKVRILRKMGRLQEAKRLSEDLFRRYYTNVQVLSESAAVLAAVGDLLRAQARLREALSKNPEDATLHYRLGRVLEQQGRYEQAKAHFKRAVANRPHFVQGWLALGRLERDLGHLDAAITRYNNLLAQVPDSKDAAVELAETLVWAGRLDEAERVLKRVPEDARSSRWKQVAGELAFMRGRMDEARTDLQAALADARGRRRAQIAALLARLYIAWDQLDEARNVLDRLEGRFRTAPEVRMTWGLLWLRRGKERRARDQFRRALKACERFSCPPRLQAAIEAYLGRSLYLLGASRAAWNHMARALRIDPNSAIAYHLFGVCLYEEEREAQAAQYLQRAHRLNPAYPDTFYYLGELARAEGRHREAARWFRRYLLARPYGSLADQARESLRAVE